MSSRTTTSLVTFAHPFVISGHEGELPAGQYEVIVEDVLLEGLSFEAYRRTGTYLLISGRAGEASMYPIDPRDLEAALARDLALSKSRDPSDAALSAQENPS